MCGECAQQFVVESDGSVYPCDFWVMEDTKLGTVVEGFVALAKQREASRLVTLPAGSAGKVFKLRILYGL